MGFFSKIKDVFDKGPDISTIITGFPGPGDISKLGGGGGGGGGGGSEGFFFTPGDPESGTAFSFDPAERAEFDRRPKRALKEINIQLAIEQLNATRSQASFQEAINQLIAPLIQGLAQEQMLLDELIPPEERAAQQQREFQAANQLLDQTMQILEHGATEFQREQIGRITESMIEQGRSDIEASAEQAYQQLFEEISPALGLRPTDTPVLDRGGRIAKESARQQDQLARQARAFEAQQLLEFPLRAGSFGEATRQFQAQLQERALTNRLNLLSGAQQGGLGLVSVAPNPSPLSTVTFPSQPGGQAFANYAGGVGSILESVGGAAGGIGALIAASSRDVKDVLGEVAARDVLEALRGLPIYRWTYTGDGTPHIGPMAEDFAEAFGVGDGKTLALVDVMGVLLAATKAQALEAHGG